MIIWEGIRGCVAFNDLWPWPIFSRSFGLDLENRFRSVASTVLGGFFPYLVQMITSMRRCVACDDLWLWRISSRSLDLDFENRVRSVTFSVLDRLFPHLPQRGRVACQVYQIIKFQFFEKNSKFSAFTSKKIYNSAYILSIFFLLGIWYESIVWVIMGRWGVFSERRRSSLNQTENIS